MRFVPKIGAELQRVQPADPSSVPRRVHRERIKIATPQNDRIELPRIRIPE